jgi:hypothetical protein
VRRLFAGMALVLAAGAFAQGAQPGSGPSPVDPLGFEFRKSPEQVQLGEPFTYELIITHLPQQRFELRPPGDLGPFEILEVARSRTDGQDKATTTFRIKMSMFELGKKRLPDLDFDVAEGSETRRFTAPGTDMEAIPSLPPDAEQKGEGLHDIRGPEDVPVRTWRLLYALLGVLVAAALAYALYRYFKRRQALPARVEPPLPLDVRTLKALDALRAEDLPGKGQHQAFYFRVSEILRAYLGERYSFEALECTSNELIEAVRKLHTPGLSLQELTDFAYTSDLVKFARSDATGDECKHALAFAYSVVRATWPPPPPAPQAQPTSAHADGSHVS